MPLCDVVCVLCFYRVTERLLFLCCCEWALLCGMGVGDKLGPNAWPKGIWFVVLESRVMTQAFEFKVCVWGHLLSERKILLCQWGFFVVWLSGWSSSRHLTRTLFLQGDDYRIEDDVWLAECRKGGIVLQWRVCCISKDALTCFCSPVQLLGHNQQVSSSPILVLAPVASSSPLVCAVRISSQPAELECWVGYSVL